MSSTSHDVSALAPGAHTITVDGVSQVYHVAGTGPVCVAHSGGPGIEWAYLRAPRLEEHFTMVYLEPVGTGASGRLDNPTDYRMDTYVRFLDAVVAHLGEPHVYLLGHSYGGFVVQRYALDHPDRVAGLALYDTSPVTGAEFWAEAVAGVAAYPQRHPDRPEAAAIPAAFDQLHAATDDESLGAALRAVLPVYLADFWGRQHEFAPLQAGVRIWATPATAQDPTPFDVRDRLGEITAPAVVIVGAYDFICGPRWAEQLHAGLTDSRLVVLERSGHFAHIEQPAEFTEAVVGLLRR
ncbi:alpha/beta hydrolase [Micromonospora sp. WMMD1120]|uniref:alpha/beta fold hydrolase n=1 Tax=Micromonospora sp. WMMD1120 TaxID=3016106 RepID=UPI002417B3A9|nr:alpha/beta hydrolase [Micromonospora sp. WMMD1120]MDG4810518.1 alpha/beta hydrolase [Micromonospora sp. WMMD1120]